MHHIIGMIAECVPYFMLSKQMLKATHFLFLWNRNFIKWAKFKLLGILWLKTIHIVKGDQKQILLFSFYEIFFPFAYLSIFLSSGIARNNESDGAAYATRTFYGHESNACRVLIHWWCTSSHWKFPEWDAKCPGPTRCWWCADVSTRWFIQPRSIWTNAYDAWT